MKYEDWIKYEEVRLIEKKKLMRMGSRSHNGESKSFGPGAKTEANYRERCLVEVLLQQQALIDALQAQLNSMHPIASAAKL